MKILSVDTATESAACAVLEDSKLLGEIIFNYKKQHSVILMEIIDSLLKNLKLDIKDMDGFVVSKGPGSFTGLRIGAAAVKGLSQGTGKPFVGISTLDSLAYNMAFTSGIICPILDALRGNVYTALYRFEGRDLVMEGDYLVLPIEELIQILNKKDEPVCFVGDGVPLFMDLLIEKIKNPSFAPLNLNIARASSLGELGLLKLKNNISEDMSFAPFYLRSSQAEREYEKKHGNSNG
ncbi:MAG: tRNA (adenosine(37)-N6)-threonylcarbamoyltransferase complex dimerization subunit type 1 TsaB [Solirubrobacterales bacterium]